MDRAQCEVDVKMTTGTMGPREEVQVPICVTWNAEVSGKHS